MKHLSFRSWRRRSLTIVACLLLAACSKTWPDTVADLGDTWPLPETEAQALRKLVGSSTLSPKHFANWKEKATLGDQNKNGAVIRGGHVVGVLFQASSLKTLAPVAALPHLVALDVAHNALSTLDGIAKLTRLQTVDAWDNPIVRVAPLAGLRSLKTLGLVDTQIKSVASLGDLPEGLTLRLGGKALRHLGAKSPQASGVTALKVYRSPKLQSLAGIETHPKLRSLTLFKDVGLMNLTGLGAAKHLRELALESLALPTLSGLAGCDALKKLKISDCRALKISSLPPLPALEELNVGRGAPGVLGLPNLPSLRKLKVIWTPVTSLSGLVGEKLPELQKMVLKSTKLPRLDTRGSFAKMHSLEIENSALTSLHGLGAFPNLEVLKIDHSKLSSLGQELALSFTVGPAEAGTPPSRSPSSAKPVVSRLTKSSASRPTSRATATTLAHLHTIRVRHSEIVTLKGLSEVAPALVRLDLRHNKLTTLTGLEGAKTLRILDVSSNALTTLAALQAVSLSRLKAHKNRLESAAPVVVAGQAARSLVYYDLRKNPLKDLPKSDRLYDAEASVRSGSLGSRYSGGGGYNSGK